jgi:hypothetical protein
MREFILLDSGPLGHACRRPGTPLADQCRLWIDALIARAAEVVVPEISDYEVRRELTRINATGSLLRLDALVTQGGLSYQPISTPAWRQAALFWADARASLAVQPLRPMHSTPTSSWQLVRRRSVNRVIKLSSPRRMWVTWPDTATRGCGQRLSNVYRAAPATSGTSCTGLISSGDASPGFRGHRILPVNPASFEPRSSA